MTVKLSENARAILKKRYLLKDANGNPTEKEADLFRRVAKAVSAKSENPPMWEHAYHDLMASLKFLPNSPTLVNAGTDGKGCLSACFVVSPEDDMKSIMAVASDAALIEKWGGGIGFGFSKLRPKKDRIATTHGEACGPIAVMRLYSSVGAALTQGAFRLGAHMGQLHVSHPDILEFIHCKDDDDILQNFNISVQITDDFMRAVEEDRDWDLVNPRDTGNGPANDVIATVPARDLWKEICASAWKTGDPGVVFIDRVLDTQPNPQMGDIQTSNPCVTGDTLVYTGGGLIRIDSLVGSSPLLSVDSRQGETNAPATNVWKSGIKPVYRLSTKEGYTVKLTADHKVFTERGKIAASSLIQGDKIHLLNHEGLFGEIGSKQLGLALGWVTGDGHIDNIRAVLHFYGKKREVAAILSDAVQSVVSGAGVNPSRAYTTNPVEAGNDRLTVSSSRLRSILMEYGLTSENWHFVPDIVYQGKREMQQAYLQALFGADGTVDGKGSEKGLNVRLNSSYYALLEGVQRLLLNFGVASRIYARRDQQMKPFPDGKGGSKCYLTQKNYDLVIGKDNVERFAADIGFLNDGKNARLHTAMDAYKKGFHKERFLATFDSLDLLGEEAVYDLTEPSTHSFVANGLVISNCGEEFLENYGNCCLGSINLDKHIGVDGFDWNALDDTVRTAVHFLDDVIEVNQFPLPKLREVNLATRRIGLGVMGWADALIRLGISYDSPQALELAERVGNFIHDTAWNESAELAKMRGAFPEYDNSAIKERGMPPVRNSSVVTIAPTGTISRIADCSSGIEPHFANAWWSNVLWKDHEGTSERMLDAPKSVWEAMRRKLGNEEHVREVLSKLADDPDGALSVLKALNMDSILRTSMDISPEAHVKMQAVWQKYATNSVSKTINMRNESTVADVMDAYHLAWTLKCKAVTVYRNSSKSMQVLETGMKEKKPATKEEKPTNAVPPKPRQRPPAISGITERVRTGHGTMYVTLNFDEDGQPFEIFTTIGKAGGSEPAHLEGLSRMISLCFRSGIDPSEIIRQLRGITSEPVWDNGVKIHSAEDAVAYVLSKHLNGESTSAKDGAEWNHRTSGNPCIECGGQVVFQEGCIKCLSCGYSKCD